MNATKPKRRHHINPRFYLRAFQIEGRDDYIWRYDSVSGEVLALSIADAAVQRDYYSHVNSDGLRDTEFVENFLSDIEGIVAPVFKKTLEGDELNDEERMNFAFFVALSLLRAPATRRQTAEMLGAMVKTVAVASSMNPEQYLASYRRFEKDTIKKGETRLSNEEIEEVRTFTLGDEYTVNIAQQMTLLPLAHIMKFAETIFQMNWTWVEAPERCDFITCDSPVVRHVPPEYQHPMMGPGLRNKFVIVSLPLSPRLCWVSTWNETAPGRMGASKNQVKSMNQLCAIHSEQYLYASTRQDGLSRLATKYNGPGMQLTPSGFGFEGEPMKVGQFKLKSKGIADPQAARNKPTSAI